MSDNQSNFSLKSEFTEYYQLSSVSQTTQPTEAECFNTPADKTINTKISDKGIMFALGFITLLLLLSGVQLHRALKVTSTKSEISKLQKIFTLDTKQLSSVIPERKLNGVQSLQEIDISIDEIEMLTIKNAIAQGKF